MRTATVTFGQRLRELREKQGLTQEQLGQRAGLHHTHICQFETSRKLPAYKILLQLARALDVSLAEFDGTSPETEK